MSHSLAEWFRFGRIQDSKVGSLAVFEPVGAADDVSALIDEATINPTAQRWLVNAQDVVAAATTYRDNARSIAATARDAHQRDAAVALSDRAEAVAAEVAAP